MSSNPFSNHKFILAPMAEITTPVLRSLIRKFSRNAILYSEMLSAHLILNGGKINTSLLTKDNDDLTVYQLLGNDPAVMRDAAVHLETLGPWGININMGCAAPEILKSRSGAYLLKEKDLARDIVRSCRKALKGRLSVKLRAGFEKIDPEFSLNFCKMLEDEGVDYITMHPRAGKQSFRGIADWKIIELLKSKLAIPVVGNGDILSAEMAAERISQTGCDAVMIGRLAVQRPWIFAECEMKGSNLTADKQIDLLEISVQVLDGIKNRLPEETHKSRSHRYLFYLCKNLSFGHPLFTSIRNEHDIDKMKYYVEGYFLRNERERFIKLKY